MTGSPEQNSKTTSVVENEDQSASPFSRHALLENFKGTPACSDCGEKKLKSGEKKKSH
jgi:hypothetical protein